MTTTVENPARTRAFQLVIQQGSYDCGLACLVMVANYYNRIVELADLRSIFDPLTNGLSIEELVETGGKIGLSLQPFLAPYNLTREAERPYISYVNDCHFVVIFGGNNPVVYDPLGLVCDADEYFLSPYYATEIIIEVDTLDNTY